jgi:hypothetical protein
MAEPKWDIVDRLEAPAYWMSGSSEGHEGENDAPREAAAEIRRLRERVAELEVPEGWRVTTFQRASDEAEVWRTDKGTWFADGVRGADGYATPHSTARAAMAALEKETNDGE